MVPAGRNDGTRYGRGERILKSDLKDLNYDVIYVR